jgi:arginine deiminase
MERWLFPNKIIPASIDDQLKYGLNFLTVKSGEILAIDGVSQAYKDRIKAAGVNATWMPFGNLTSGYGAAHCTTQVIHRECKNSYKVLGSLPQKKYAAKIDDP